MIVEYQMNVAYVSDQATGPSGRLQPSLVVKPRDLVLGILHSLSKAKVGKVEAFNETLYPPSSRFVLKGLRAQSSFNGNVVEIVKYLPDKGRYRVSPVEALSVTPVTLDVRPQNLVPASREISTTRESRETERRSLFQSGRKNFRRSLFQSGRKNFRRKLTARNPEFLRSTSMPNVTARARKQISQQSSLKDVQQPSMQNTMAVTPGRKPSQRSLHNVSDSKLLERRSNNRRASSARDITVSPRNQKSRRAKNERASSSRDVTASTREQKSRKAPSMEKKQTSDRTLLRSTRRSSEAKCVDNEHMLPKQHDKPSTKIRLQGFLEDSNCNRVKPDSAKAADVTSTKAISSLPVHTRKVPTTAHATNGQTVTSTKVLIDHNCNRVKPDGMEAPDAMSSKAASNHPVHTGKVPTTAHATNGQTVTSTKVLIDHTRNRVKPDGMEAPDAMSSKAASSRPVHTGKVPTTAHATRRPVTPINTSSQRSVVQHRKRGPRSASR
jgi:hypothetical protein